MYVAFDDTDSISSMCTTFLATEVVRALSDLDLIGHPRLVRLNPAVPWKTRGNGALALRFGVGRGRATTIGRIAGKDVLCYPECRAEADRDHVLETCSRLIDRWSRTQEDASPGLVVSERRPTPSLYWQAVRGIVARTTVEEELRRLGADTYQLAGGRGIIGAAAAMAWRPRDRTYEALVYRRKAAWGTPRKVNVEDVGRLDELFPSTFNNFDHQAGRTAIVPHSTCPILFGVRGDNAEEVALAAASVRSEPKDRWLVFLSNQGTDDHVVRGAADLRPWSSYLIRGQVLSVPRTIAGGHVLFRLRTEGGQELDCAAYEPSKGFRAIVRKLSQGDVVEVMGELRETPRTLNLEKLHVIQLAVRKAKAPNPICPECGKRMGSMGREGGFRCKRCRTKADVRGEGQAVERDISLGWYEPPVRSRRHISKPLKRMGMA
ncbi:MAG: tRNA(Ile)(2)-agmatinylcytidine synthase [Methanomassiliicoccales archaeon]|nr:tRNA(Ile)(2)-agmatinylcytidine synthase [Methanomassiliicoccales archaeon]MDD1756241.1 tRNA(Ile)(2)-agmatinylcytidine synthase [Methanomassiliicoccales archaeon]